MSEVAIVLGILILAWSHTWAYKFGKRMAFDLIEQHTNPPHAFSVEKALRYERDVMNGKVPRG